MNSSPLFVLHFATCWLLLCFASVSVGVEIRVIEAGTEPAIEGKEVDWIYGDYLMQNAELSVIVGAPLSTRDANMTVRNVGASILDLTLNQPSNDQLSAYTPAGGKYAFHDPDQTEFGREGDSVFWQCRSSKALLNDGTTATVRYRLTEGKPYVESTVIIDGEASQKVKSIDAIRADGWFELQQSDQTAYCVDSFHRQTIGFQAVSTRSGEPSDQPLQWKKGRPHQLRYSDAHVERTEDQLKWTVRLYAATSPIDLITVAERKDAEPPVSATMCQFRVSLASAPSDEVDWVNRAKVTLRSADQAIQTDVSSEPLQTDDQGFAHARLAPGAYTAVASAIGYESVEVAFSVGEETDDETKTISLPLAGVSGFDATATNEQGKVIPVKATIYRLDGEDPDFGLSSARTFVKNCVYSVHGNFHCPLDPGKYEVYFSHGPEHDSEMRQINVVAKTITRVAVQLDRVVDTAGWVSTELHSHSSPSGDNTSDQFGRVENLVCEHLEFAPCTEHNRVSSYAPHLAAMGLSDVMATCTGIELTGSPLPANHQNAFPLHHHPHTQNGGGPRTSSNPVVQIERLAMWDDGSDKIVQMNHPNLHQIHGDLDVDGEPDQGFRGMLQWMDVVEVHPLQTIFEDVAASPPSVRRMRIPLFQWMQLLNQGHRIPGVVNTDAHYNHHGSGWRRNWFASSTDNPAQISTDEMIRQAEAGHIVMSTGPFLSVEGRSGEVTKSAMPGDDLAASDGSVTLQVVVQCPNWLDVNRVQIFVNGRPSESHNYTRKSSPELFGDLDSVRKFDSSIKLKLDTDSHVIVATIGEGMNTEKIMGSREGSKPPIAVSNPIFVDVDGKGFDHNHDELGLPLPGLDH